MGSIPTPRTGAFSAPTPWNLNQEAQSSVEKRYLARLKSGSRGFDSSDWVDDKRSGDGMADIAVSEAAALVA